MEEIRDQQRLFQKLFQSPSCLEPPPKLILSMQFLKLLLQELRQLTLVSQKTLLLQILELFRDQPINSLLLYQQDHSSSEQTPLLTLTVLACARICRTSSDIEEMLPLFDALLGYYPVGVEQVSSLTRELGRQFQEGRFNPLKTRFIHLVLEKYYGPKKGLNPLHSCYFFLWACNETSTLRSPQDTSLRFKNEIAVMFSFLLLQPPHEGLVLFRIETPREEITLQLGKKVSIVNETTRVTFSEEENIKTMTWYRILVNLTTSETSIYLNGEELLRDRSMLKKQKEIEITQFSFGEGLFGFISGIAIAEKAMSSAQIKQLPQLKKWGSVASLKDKNLSNYFVTCCLPFSVFELRDIRHCFDIFRRNHNQMGENVIIFKDPSESIQITHMGGLDIILPLFYLARFYSRDSDPDHLERILRIWLSALHNFKDAEKNEDFLLGLGHHLEALPHLLTEKCVGVLSQIYEKLSLTNKLLFLKHVGWSGLPGKSSGQASSAWLNWLTRLYQNNKSQCLRAYNLLDVVFWLVKYLQNSQQHCCPSHYLSEARILRQFSLETLSELEKTTKQPHFAAVENIAAVILEYYIIDHDEQALKDVKGILRLLLHKYSNCLYATILRILKRQIAKFRQDQYIGDFLQRANILPFLAALAEKVVDPGLLGLVVHLMLLVSQAKQELRNDVVDFLSIVLRRMKDLMSHPFNILAHGAKKVRKKSVDIENKDIQASETADLIRKISIYRQNFSDIKFLLLNFSFGVIGQLQTTKVSKFNGEEGFKLLRYFFPLAPHSVKIEILSVLFDKLKDSPLNLDLAIKSTDFSRLLLTSLSQISEECNQAVSKIFSEQFKHLLKKGVSPIDYYLFLKNLSRSQVNLLHPLSQALEILMKDNIPLHQLINIFLLLTFESKIMREESASYWNVMVTIFTKISSFLIPIDPSSIPLYELTSVQLLERVKGFQENEFFNIKINIVAEQQVTFLFDIILPKIVADCDISALLKDNHRQVYFFQLFINQGLQLLRKGKNISNQLVILILQFIWQQILNKQPKSCKSFMRMTLFMVSHTLAKLQMIQPLLLIWSCIIDLLKDIAIRRQSTNFGQLAEHLHEESIQPYLVQIFQVFLRPNNQDYILTFNDLVKLKAKDDTRNFITSILLPVFLNSQLQSVSVICEEYAWNALIKQFQQKLMSGQAKLDFQDKKCNKQKLFTEIERIFEQESIGEQETRLRYFHQYECNIRRYHSLWNKLWKRLRIYHHPYGIFAAQKNNSSAFLFSDNSLKNFRFKISKYSSESGIQPILEAQVQEPWHVCKRNQQESRNQMSSLVQMMRPSHNFRRKNQSVLGGFISRIRRQKQEEAVEYEVLWIKRGRKARGKLMFNDQQQIVFWYDSLKQEDSHLSFERFSLPFNKLMVKRWRVDYIRSVSRKRYLMDYHAIQLSLLQRKGLLFYFPNQNSQHFLDQLVTLRQQKLQRIGAKLKLNRVPFYSDEWIQEGLSSRITQDWRNRKISTLAYLLAVNKAASRGIYDISQYPVVPWICQMNEEKQPTFRDLSKTMGGLGSEERKRIVREKYSAADPFNPVPPFHFGTHYSSPGVVFNFLIRLAPFSDYCKNLQGGKFDIPDRLFASLVSAWRSACNQVSDVRQLLPQFYYLPQCLLNSERLHLGITQSGQTVDSVELPPWAAGNPYFLTTQLRQMLESDETGKAIGQWIDLIFGFKQRGDEAKNNYNVYYYLTYEDYSNCIAQHEDEVYRKSCEAQVVHFGQIPPQIFQRQHVSRLPSSGALVQLKIIEKVQLMNAFKQRLHGAFRFNNELFLVRRADFQILSLAKSPAALLRTTECNIERTLSKAFFNLKKEQARCIFFKLKGYFLLYGYVTNQFRIFNRSTGAIQFHESVDSKIEFMMLNQQESLLLIGCHSGLLHVYELQYQTNKVNSKRIHSEIFSHPIVHISECDGFYAISFGCLVSIYKIERSLYYLTTNQPTPFVRFFRSFRNTLPVRGAFIADCPLFCLLLYDNAHIKVYSINGQFIRSIPCSPRSIFPMKDADLNSLFCSVQEGRLMLLSTPDLRCVSEMEINDAIQVIEGIIVYRRQIHFVGCQ